MTSFFFTFRSSNDTISSVSKTKKLSSKTETKATIETSSSSGSNKDVKEDEKKISDRSQMFLSLIYDLPPTDDEDDNSKMLCLNIIENVKLILVRPPLCFKGVTFLLIVSQKY